MELTSDLSRSCAGVGLSIGGVPPKGPGPELSSKQAAGLTHARLILQALRGGHLPYAPNWHSKSGILGRHPFSFVTHAGCRTGLVPSQARCRPVGLGAVRGTGRRPCPGRGWAGRGAHFKARSGAGVWAGEPAKLSKLR